MSDVDIPMSEAIKVEPLEGDHTRKLVASGAGFFPTYNRNKKSIAVDLKSARGRDIVMKLIRSADVVSENFRPGAMEKLGFGDETVSADNPPLIYCSHKGFLPGPYEHRTALDEVVQMMGGLAYMTGKAATPMPDRIRAWAVYDVFKSSDGEQVFVGVVTDTQWKVFCDAFGLAHLLSDATLLTNPQRVDARDRIIPIVAGLFAKLTKQEIMDRCEALGLPFAPIARPEDLWDDPHLNASGGLAPVTLLNGEKTKVPLLPVEMNGKRFGTRLDVPSAGEHTRELLAGLGYGKDEIAKLVNERVVAGG